MMFEQGAHASPHRIGSLSWAMDKSVAVRLLVVLVAGETGLLLALAF